MKTILAVIAVIIVAGIAYFVFAPKTQAPVTNPETAGGTSAPLETTNPVGAGDTTTTVSTTNTVTVTYDGKAFSPASVSIKKGDTVKFVNTSGSPMWVASDPHPMHSGYSGTTVSQHCPDTAGTAFDECSTASTYSFVFGKVGSWGYHNHVNHCATGTIVVNQ